VDERVLLESLRRPDPFSGKRPQAADAGQRINLDAVMASPGALDPQAAQRALEPVESTLLRLLLLHPELQPGLRDRLTADQLATTPARELWRAILADRDGDPQGRFERDRFLEGLDPTLSALARTLYARTDPLPETGSAAEQAIDQCLLRLEGRRLSELLDYKRAELAEAEAAPDGEGRTDRDELLREIVTLEGQRAGLDRRIADSSLLQRLSATRPAREPSRDRSPEPTTEPERISAPTGGTT